MFLLGVFVIILSYVDIVDDKNHRIMIYIIGAILCGLSVYLCISNNKPKPQKNSMIFYNQKSYNTMI